MDHHELITFTRKLMSETQRFAQERGLSRTWAWEYTPLVFPETHCPWCQVVLRSPYIWFLRGEKLEYLVGVIEPKQGERIRLIHPGHPHGGTPLCLGRNLTGAALISSTVNLGDCSMTGIRIPIWFKNHWRHTCDGMVNYLTRYMGDNPDLNYYLQELGHQ